MGICVAALCVPAAVPIEARLVYNPTDSVARGWYLIGPPVALHVGSIVLVRLPADVAAFAAQRGYLPKGVPILKRIGAVAPQSVCVREQTVHIDGAAMTTTLAHDGKHRPLQPWGQCRVLKDGELFLLSDVQPASFDSRYFGPIDASAVLGNAQPIWTGGAQ
nr:S26 family signal peptidase [Acidovorax sp. JMULE5]